MRRGNPCWGRRVAKRRGACWYELERQNRNLCSTDASTSLASSIANVCPMHVWGPNPKGINPCASLQAPEIPFANRSGRKSSASSPQSCWSRCITPERTVSRTPGGAHNFCPAIVSMTWLVLVSLTFVRDINCGTGGYNRNVSFKIISNCKEKKIEKYLLLLKKNHYQTTEQIRKLTWHSMEPQHNKSLKKNNHGFTGFDAEKENNPPLPYFHQDYVRCDLFLLC